MKDLMGLMKQAKEMQEKMQSMQTELAEASAVGNAGGDLVKVELNGQGDMISMEIDPSLLKGDEADILEDLIIAAHNDAKVKVAEITEQKTKELTEGLPLPPGMKLPFG